VGLGGFVLLRARCRCRGGSRSKLELCVNVLEPIAHGSRVCSGSGIGLLESLNPAVLEQLFDIDVHAVVDALADCCFLAEPAVESEVDGFGAVEAEVKAGVVAQG
jgi:hypothetical protein